MECHEVKNWIANRDLFDERVSAAAGRHLASCSTCQSLYKLDTLAEERTKKAFEKEDVPQGLLSRLNSEILTEQTKGWTGVFGWRRLLPVAAVTVLILITVFNPFSNTIRGLEQMSAYAMENHLEGESTMAFNAVNVNDVGNWFLRRIGYAVILPDMDRLGLKLLGGRECSLGKHKAAYLYCKKDGRKASLFIVDSSRIGFRLNPNELFSHEENGYGIQIWRSGSMVYTLVEEKV